jgi:hypothetical protein
MESLTEIMKNNIFQFGDTYWRQTSGTAMGTSTAVNYAVLYVGLLEITKLLPKFPHNLLYLKLFIDDIVGVWIPSAQHPGTTFDQFMEDLNDFGTLKWTCDDGLVDNLRFLDMTVSINSHRQLEFRTYQKDMNLYLYIPPTSAHPPNMLKGLIFGRLRAYWIQNTHTDNFIHFSTLLAKRLTARGWPKQTVISLMQEASDRLTKPNILPTQPIPMLKPIIFHLPFHPRGIQRQTIRNVFNKTVGRHITDRKLIVAVSRPRNLYDRLCQTKLNDVEGKNPSNFMNQGRDL